MSKVTEEESQMLRLVALVKKWIILEPSIFLFLMSARMVYFTRQNLFLEVVCTSMADINTCHNMTEEFKDKVALEAADMISVILRIENIGPILLCVLSGPVSDKYGRRLPLILSSVGMLASYIGYFVLSLVDPKHELPRNYYILPSIGISLGGQFFVFFQMFFAYTSDVSETNRESADHKFRRFIIAEGSVYFGAVTGSYVGGLMYSKVGYSRVFLTSVILMIVSIVYAYIKMGSERRKACEVKLNPVSLFVETFTVVLRARPGRERSLVILATVGFVLFEAPFPIDDNLLFIHLKDKFGWVEEDFTNFQAFWTMSMVIGQFCLTPLLQKLFNLSSPIIGIMSVLSKSSYYLLLTSSSSQWMVFVAAVLGMEGGMGNIVNRSLLAHLVGQEELGKVYGLLAILDAVLPFIVCPFSTFLYRQTQHSLPSSFCLLNSLILVVAAVVFLVVYIIVKRENIQFDKRPSSDDNNNKDSDEDNKSSR